VVVSAGVCVLGGGSFVDTGGWSRTICVGVCMKPSDGGASEEIRLCVTRVRVCVTEAVAPTKVTDWAAGTPESQPTTHQRSRCRLRPGCCGV
jgi:hypothetical protein